MSRRSSERGSAMLITMVLISAILAGAAVMVSLQMGANRNSEVTRTGMTALYCAEAGLTATRATVAENRLLWPGKIGTGVEPDFLSTINHDLDADGVADFYVTLEDDDDEFPTSGTANVTTVDVNQKVFIVARCGTVTSGVFVPKYADFPREVRELVSILNIVNCYNAQRGGCGGNGNFNN